MQETVFRARITRKVTEFRDRTGQKPGKTPRNLLSYAVLRTFTHFYHFLTEFTLSDGITASLLIIVVF